MFNRNANDPVPGFEWYSRSFLLPTQVAYQISCEAKLEHERKLAEAAELESSEELIEKSQASSKGCSLTSKWQAEGPSLKVFREDQLVAYAEKVDSVSGDSDRAQQMKALLLRLANAGNYRKLATIPVDWRNRLAELQESHINFTPVLQYLRGVCVVAEHGDGVPSPVNIVLDGPPGCGKTYFTKRLAWLLNTEYHAVHLETMQTSSELLGVSDTYSNTKPGRLFDALIDGEYANPVILMDELCKLNGDTRFDPSTALYRLFERETARTFSDACAHWLTLDYSKAWFVCTSNNFDSIDAPLRSRLKRFSISMPKDLTAIIHNIMEAARIELPSTIQDIRLTDEAIDLLKSQSPRRIRQLIDCAIGAALSENRRVILAVDIDAEPEKKGIGF